jgi:hypothetical protein
MTEAPSSLMDMLPVPDDTTRSDPQHKELAKSLADEPTLSHALAIQDHEVKGAAQRDHEVEEVADLGWNESADHIVSVIDSYQVDILTR